VLVGIQILTGLAAVLFGATAFLSVWDSAGKFAPLYGFLQNLGLALGAMAVGFLAAYFQKQP
jgi:hypothetical protein